MGITAHQKAIRLGYKQTELGIIPEDWECITVGQLVHNGILEKPLDGNHGNIHPKSGDFVSFGIPFVMANNVQLKISSLPFQLVRACRRLQYSFGPTSTLSINSISSKFLIQRSKLDRARSISLLRVMIPGPERGRSSQLIYQHLRLPQRRDELPTTLDLGGLDRLMLLQESGTAMTPGH